MGSATVYSAGGWVGLGRQSQAHPKWSMSKLDISAFCKDKLSGPHTDEALDPAQHPEN